MQLRISEMKQTYFLLCLALMATCLVVPSAARGGRGRGGGSFGGLFGGWRSKYGSKSSSTGNGRRVVNGSPSQASMPRLPPPPPPPAKPISISKQQAASYPRQQLPPGYGYAPAPGQGMYYANAQTLPAGAVYYAQPPPSMSMGSGNFLSGMLAGHMMNSMLYGHRHHHVSPVYRQNPQGEPAANGNGREVIIINNGQAEATAEAETIQPLNESLLPEETVQSSEDPLDNGDEEQESSYSEEEPQAAALPEPPVGGIVCFPIMLNETDPQNPELVQEVERVVCFPAPSPAPQAANPLCQNDPQCILEQGGSTTSTVPPIVAGDIGAATEAPSPETTSILADAEEELD